MRQNLEIAFILVCSLLFIAVNGYYVYNNTFFVAALPFALIAGAFVLFAPTKVFFALAFMAPLSIPFRKLAPGLSFDFLFPTELILVSLLILVILKAFKEKYFQKELLTHPVFIAMLFYLGWILIAVIPSEMPVVSIKYFLVRFWYLGIFFYLAYILFSKNIRSISWFLWAYIAGLFIVVVLSITKQASISLFSHRAAHFASSPFFNDHTSYGAALALIIPVVAAFAVNNKKPWLKLIIGSLTIFFLFALVLSYSRAAWLSLFIGLGVWALIMLKIKFRTLLVTGAILVGLFFAFQQEIMWRLERNTTDSSGDLTEHLQSIFNITSDASNLERLNRWDAALDMFVERPLYGFGPGTYQFEYAPFQKSYHKTVISTNFGTVGNAHSEYLGLMSEAGLVPTFAFILIWVFVLYRGLKLIQKQNISSKHRNIVIACIVGLVTYIFHGFLNNFLDVDKIAALFWGYMAIIVALEFHYKQMAIAEPTQKEKASI